MSRPETRAPRAPPLVAETDLVPDHCPDPDRRRRKREGDHAFATLPEAHSIVSPIGHNLSDYDSRPGRARPIEPAPSPARQGERQSRSQRLGDEDTDTDGPRDRLARRFGDDRPSFPG